MTLALYYKGKLDCSEEYKLPNNTEIYVNYYWYVESINENKNEI